MKPTVVFDTAFFAVPNYAGTRDEALQIFRTIREWSTRAERQSAFNFCTTSGCLSTLTQANAFPFQENIRVLLEMFELEHVFSPRDIASRITSLVQRSTSIEEVLGFGVVQATLMGDEPPELQGGVHPALQVATVNLLATVSTQAEVEPRSREILFVVPGFSVATGAWPNLQINLVDADHRRFPGGLGVAQVLADFRLIETPRQLVDALDAEKVWLNAEDGDQMHLAISLVARGRLGTIEPDLPPKGTKAFCVGTDFFQAAEANQAGPRGRFSGVVRETCAQVISQEEEVFERDFKVTRADGAEARRVQITKSHQALRLMFWARTNGEIEFSNVGVKKELAIADGAIGRSHAVTF